MTVIQTTGPLSYKVRSQTGHVLWRHVDQLRYRYTTENQVLNPESVDLENWPLPSLPSTTNVGTSLQTRTSISNDSTIDQPVRRSTRVRRSVNRYSPQVTS